MNMLEIFYMIFGNRSNNSPQESEALLYLANSGQYLTKRIQSNITDPSVPYDLEVDGKYRHGVFGRGGKSDKWDDGKTASILSTSNHHLVLGFTYIAAN